MSTRTLPASSTTAQFLLSSDPGQAQFWNKLVDSAPVPDVYYRPGYVRAYEAAGRGTGAAVLVEAAGLRALFPLLLRPLRELSFAADDEGLDAVTPYGYGGVLLLDERIPAEESVRELVESLQRWCRDNGIVSVLLRLHPVVRQEDWIRGGLGSDCRLHDFGPTTALDLASWNESTESIGTLNKGRRSDLAFARRYLHVTWSSDGRSLEQDLGTFSVLYEQRMEELHAGEYYRFPMAYYVALAEGLGHNLDVAIAWQGDEAVGAALFMFDRVMGHYHLSASNDAGRAHKATTLILNAAVGKARQRGCRRLHLGGGTGGDDKLFAFKQSFGGEVFRYSFLSVVADRLRYDRLVQMRVAAARSAPLRPNFFPEYRA